MNIDEMPAGREIDVLVAEKVMGWYYDPKLDTYATPENPGVIAGGVPYYSTNISAALEVIERLGELLGAWFEIKGPRKWLARCHCPNKQCTAIADTVSLAVCRAALKAIEGPSGHNMGPSPNLVTAILSSLPSALQGKLEEGL